MISIVLKTTTRYKRCKEKFKNPLPSSEIQSNPVKHFELYSKSMLRLIKELINRHKRNNIFCVSQQWLATVCGITREWINKLLSQLEEQGIIKMLYINKQKSYYRVSSFFTNSIIASLSHLWRAWPLTLLFSNPSLNTGSEKSSQLLDEDIYILNPDPSPTYSRDFNSVRAYAHVEKTPPPLAIEGGRIIIKKEEVVKRSNIIGDRSMSYLPSQQRQLLNALTTEDSSEPLFSEAIQSITSLNLTTFGKIKLLAFPEFVIKKVEEEAKDFKNPKDPFGLFIATAIRISKEYGIQPDWKWVNAIKEKLNLSDQTPSLVVSPKRDSLKREGGRTFTKQSTTSSVSWEEAIRHNRRLTEIYNKNLADTLPPVEEVIAQRLKFESLSEEEQQRVRYEKICGKKEKIEPYIFDDISDELDEQIMKEINSPDYEDEWTVQKRKYEQQLLV